MEVTEILRIIKDLTQGLETDLDKLRSVLHELNVQFGVDIAKLQASMESNQQKLDALDRIIVRGNGEKPLRVSVVDILEELKRQSDRLEAIEAKLNQRSTNTTSNDSGSNLLALMSDRNFWIALVLGLSTLGGIIAATGTNPELPSIPGIPSIDQSE